LLRFSIRQMCAERLKEERRGGVAAAAARFQAQLAQLRTPEGGLRTATANLQHCELPPEFFAHCLGPRLKYSSEPHRAYIESCCRERGLNNVAVLTCDATRLELPAAAFDRCVSIEMFEHLRNYETLLARIACWLRPQGKLFVHILAPRAATDTLLWFQRDLQVEHQWQLDGTHYERTANHWLQNQDRRGAQVLSVLCGYYGDRHGRLWFQRWRMFWMACAETFGYARGQEWVVAHYRLTQRE
jgi:cyclopropane-fatty-acyl-phospholipid synthase